MKNENLLRLRHILDAIQAIESFVRDVDEQRFVEEQMRHDATIRQLEIIGEAAKNLSEDLRQENSQVAWKEAGHTRDRLAHGYFQLNLEIIWDITQNDLPILKKQIEEILENLK